MKEAVNRPLLLAVARWECGSSVTRYFGGFIPKETKNLDSYVHLCQRVDVDS